MLFPMEISTCRIPELSNGYVFTATAATGLGDVAERGPMSDSTARKETGHSEYIHTQKKKLHGLSPRANYADRATAACRRSDCQLLRIKGATWSA
jgi:hypothetical protein